MEYGGFFREYYIFHKFFPERKVKFRTLRSMSVKQIKQKMVDAGFFAEDIIKELRVEKIS